MIRVRRSLAELLADVPSYVREVETLRAVLIQIRFLPNVLADIVGSYATAKWHDELMAIWKMASTKVSEYNRLHTTIWRVGEGKFKRSSDQDDAVATMLVMLGTSTNISARPAAQQIIGHDYYCDVRICAAKVSHTIRGSNDMYSMDTFVLDAVYSLILAIDGAAGFSLPGRK